MLAYAVKYREAINGVTQRQELGLGKFKLSNHEWVVAEQLSDVLLVLKDTTLFFSHATLNLVTIIPAMDHIDSKMMTFAQDQQYLPAICSAVKLVQNTLNCYYSLTDSSDVYHNAMILHPCHKLSYFTSAHWEDEWIQMAEDLVCEEYECSYLPISANIMQNVHSDTLDCRAVKVMSLL
ncbi:hypothetical protein PISMIDRAFT_110330 [Pisolithus microcarpus 441]|uniref:Uncharacterized protein n=1 Tax=Pisolithus microcarpus 441 TaxID=765257 RepID=A0A0C9YVE7_9AGAM|nr:hypothetical protein PISMIDRAFT_110330 [Pisolithus microcarpus 441]